MIPIPPQLVGPLIKVGVAAAVLVFVYIGGLFHGRSMVQEAWDAAIAEQAIAAAAQVIDQAENTARVEVQYIKVKGETEIKTKIVNREVVRYVESPAQKCLLSPEFVRSFDLISSLSGPGEDGLPAASDTAGAAPEPSSPRITDVAVLRAYEHAVVQLRDLWIVYDALRGWVRSNHTLAKETP